MTDKLPEVIRIFNLTFQHERVRISGGRAEPFYLALGPDGVSEIGFTFDYLNSCFHEAAHWCIAGKARRQLDDYGYWYRPDGRTGSEQAEFFQAEAAPQALECVFAISCGESFRISCDNLGGEASDETAFREALKEKLVGYFTQGFPFRASAFLHGLLEYFHPEIPKPERINWLYSQAALFTAGLLSSFPCHTDSPIQTSPSLPTARISSRP